MICLYRRTIKKVGILFLLDVESNSRFIESFVPVLNIISQWTQALSANGNVTIFLVPLAAKEIMEAIDLMSTPADDFRKESDNSSCRISS